MPESTTAAPCPATESPPANATEGDLNGHVGSTLVNESDRVRVWMISLAPGEHLPSHTHVLNYFWTATTDGRARSRFSDGRVTEMDYRIGDTRHFSFGPGESMTHDLENIGQTTLCFTTVEFLDSANAPLKLGRQRR